MSCNSLDGALFHRSHLWIRPSAGSREAHIGISDFAQKQLGKILYVELPRAGDHIEAESPFGTVESYKVVSELIAPASGEVLAANQDLSKKAGLLNEDCYGDGWLLTIRLVESADLSSLMAHESYLAFLGERGR